MKARIIKLAPTQPPVARVVILISYDNSGEVENWNKRDEGVILQTVDGKFFAKVKSWYRKNFREQQKQKGGRRYV